MTTLLASCMLIREYCVCLGHPDCPEVWCLPFRKQGPQQVAALEAKPLAQLRPSPWRNSNSKSESALKSGALETMMPQVILLNVRYPSI